MTLVLYPRNTIIPKCVANVCLHVLHSSVHICTGKQKQHPCSAAAHTHTHQWRLSEPPQILLLLLVISSNKKRHLLPKKCDIEKSKIFYQVCKFRDTIIQNESTNFSQGISPKNWLAFILPLRELKPRGNKSVNLVFSKIKLYWACW